jgi:hypothetical protein
MRGKFLPLIVAGVLLVVMVPLVAAFEAHTVNVTAHVKHRFNLTKTIRPATVDEIDYVLTSGILHFPSTPYTGNISQDGDGVWHVPEGKVIVWMVEITVSNPHGYDMYDVMVRDHFGAELTGMDGHVIYPDSSHPEDWGTVGHGIYWIRGAGEVSFIELNPEDAGPVLFYYRKESPPWMPQFTIFWYATWEEGDPHMNQQVQENDLRNKAQVPPVDNFDDVIIGPGQSTTLTLMVWTRVNHGGHQEYTSPGNYDLNSGPTAWWLDEEGQQFSSKAPSIPVIVD